MSDNFKRFQQILKLAAKGKKGARDMNREDARFALEFLFSEESHPVQVGALLTLMRFKGSTEEELLGFLDAVENHSRQLNHNNPGVFNPNGPYDGRGSSLNLSVAASILVSAANIPVLLHSSTDLPPKRGVTDAHVLEALGVPCLLEADHAEQNLTDKNFSFLHSSKFSFGIEKLRTVREILLYRSFLHTLEVLQDPGRSKFRVIGVAHAYFCEKFAAVVSGKGASRVLALPGLDGGPEAPLRPVTGIEIADGRQRELRLDPGEFGLPVLPVFESRNAKETAAITYEILNRKQMPERGAVLYNAGIRLYICNAAPDIRGGIRLAEELLESGAGLQKLESLTGSQM